MSSAEEQAYIALVLQNEVREHFQKVAKEYRQERDLGLRGEFVAIYRKVRKLKTVIWDGESDEDWREDKRTIALEVVAHGLLMLCDIDKEEQVFGKRLTEAVQEHDERKSNDAS